MTSNQKKGIGFIIGGILSIIIIPRILLLIGLYGIAYYLQSYYIIYVIALILIGLGIKSLMSKNTKKDEVINPILSDSNQNISDLSASQQVENQQQYVVKKKKKNVKWIIILVIILGLILPFHYVPSQLKVFPKDNLTFSNTIITQGDIDKLLKRYNDCENIFQQQSIRNEPLFRKLSEKGIIYDIKK